MSDGRTVSDANFGPSVKMETAGTLHCKDSLPFLQLKNLCKYPQNLFT